MFIHVVWSDRPEKSNVIVAVVFGHLVHIGFMGAINFHFPVQAIVEQEIVSHSNPVGFHGMPLSVVVISHISIVVVANIFFTVWCNGGHFDKLMMNTKAEEVVNLVC